jgi:hypothetical protein
MAGLPKKYAKMGFKDGWAAYKAATKSKSSSKATKRTVKVKTVAKKKSGRKKAKVKTSTGMEKFLNKAISKALPVLWGYGREPVNNWLANSAFGKMLPNFGRFGDEASILMLNYGATALGARSNKYSRKALQVIETAELASVGEELYNGRKSKSNDFSNDF